MRRILHFSKLLVLLYFSIFLTLTGCGNEKAAPKSKELSTRLQAASPQKTVSPASPASTGNPKNLQTPVLHTSSSSPSAAGSTSSSRKLSLPNDSSASAPLVTNSGQGEESSYGDSVKLNSLPSSAFSQNSGNSGPEPNVGAAPSGASLPVFVSNAPVNNSALALRDSGGENSVANNNVPAGGNNLSNTGNTGNAGSIVLRGTSSAASTTQLPPVSGNSSGASPGSSQPAPRVVAVTSSEGASANGTPPGDSSKITFAPTSSENSSGSGDSKIASASDGILSSNPDPVQAYEETMELSLHVPGTPNQKQDVLIFAPPSPDQPFTGELEIKGGYSDAELFDCGDDCKGKTYTLRVLQCGVISEATLKEKLGEEAFPSLNDNVYHFFLKLSQGTIPFETCPSPQYRDIKADANLKISFANFPLSVDGMYLAFLLPENAAERESLGASAVDNAVSLTGNKALWEKNAQYAWPQYLQVVSSPSLIPSSQLGTIPLS